MCMMQGTLVLNTAQCCQQYRNGMFLQASPGLQLLLLTSLWPWPQCLLLVLNCARPQLCSCHQDKRACAKRQP
jgi:hypothetical protein